MATTTKRFDVAVPQFTVVGRDRDRRVLPRCARLRDRRILGWAAGAPRQGQARCRPYNATRCDSISNRADQAEVRTGRPEAAYDVYLHVTGADVLAEQLRSPGAVILDGPEERV